MRHRAGNREQLEAVLTDAELSTLRRLAIAHAVPPGRWHLAAPIARPFETLCLERLAAQFMEEEATLERARLRAAVVLGIEVETVTSRIKRAGAQAVRRSSTCTGGPAPAGATVDV